MGAVDYIKTKYYQYELWTALYMLEPWEKAIFNLLVIVLISFTLYSSWVYIPDYLEYSIFIATDYFPQLSVYLPPGLISKMKTLKIAKYGK